MFRIFLLTALAMPLYAQTMPGMSMDGMDMGQPNAAGEFLTKLSSGTAVNPESWPMPMVMKKLGAWNAMFMGNAFLNATQQSGPRGGDKLYSPNWLMANAVRDVGGKAAIQFDLMLSLEPATVTARSYPLLFQTGETAFGKPLVDAQHPHDFIMAAGILYARSLAEHTTLELYFAPVGDPALGPVAYPHRASAIELPQATLSHHWQDSSHIANEVVTAGLAYKKLKLEASGFYGAEPNENRWNLDSGPIDSWSTRLWYLPSKDWAAQVSVGRLARPEKLEAGDQVRSTASAHYSRPIGKEAWSTSIVWGRNHSTATKRNTDAWLIESVAPAGRNNEITGRWERVQKDELTVPGTHAIGAYTIGYTRDVGLFRYVRTGVGFNVSAYAVPRALQPDYGNHPVGGNIFLRLRLRSPS